MHHSGHQLDFRSWSFDFGSFLPDDQYGVALDNLVKGCTDILLLSPNGEKVFVGKRCVQPQVGLNYLSGVVVVVAWL